MRSVIISMIVCLSLLVGCGNQSNTEETSLANYCIERDEITAITVHLLYTTDLHTVTEEGIDRFCELYNRMCMEAAPAPTPDDIHASGIIISLQVALKDGSSLTVSAFHDSILYSGEDMGCGEYFSVQSEEMLDFLLDVRDLSKELVKKQN